MGMLLRVQHQLPVESDNADSLVRSLMDSFCKKDTDSVVKVKIMAVLASLVKTPGFNALAFADDLMAMVKNEGE